MTGALRTASDFLWLLTAVLVLVLAVVALFWAACWVVEVFRDEMDRRRMVRTLRELSVIAERSPQLSAADAIRMQRDQAAARPRGRLRRRP